MQIKKSLFVLSVIGCVFLCSSAFAAQSGAFTYSVSASDNVTITGYTGTGGNVVIPDTIAGMAVVRIEPYAFQSNSTIISVTIPATVTQIWGTTLYVHKWYDGCHAPMMWQPLGGSFYYCPNLTVLYFKGGYPEVSYAPPYAGDYCSFPPVQYIEFYEVPCSVYTNVADTDGDGIFDAVDNCPGVYNPQQLDTNGNGIGDVCDSTPGCGGCGQAACEQYADSDGDGIPDVIDNCPTMCNSQQLDADNDGVGDVCDTTPGCGGCGQIACEAVCTHP